MPFLFAVLLQNGARADDPLARQVDGRSFDQFMQVALQDYAVPGAVVVVSSAHGTSFLKGYGVRRQGTADAVDENPRFQIASMSKFIAATAVGVLVDRGVVSWDVPMQTFSPETVLTERYATENATLRDYFAHRTGLPAYGGDLLTQLGYSPDELVRRARFLPFDHSFRAEWAYSNYGIFLGQQSSAYAAGASASALLSTEIFQPLGMTRSGPTQAELFKDDNRAAAHNLDGSVMPYENVDSFSGAGAVVSTGADIARWMRMLLADGMFEGRRVLSKDFLRYRVIEKNGALNGMRTIVALIPERGIGIAAFANKQLTVLPEAVRAEFLEREVGPSGRDLQAQIRDEQAAWNALVAVPTPPADAQPLGRDLEAFTGRFASALFGPLEVIRDGRTLGVSIGERNFRRHLTHWSGDTFLLTFDNPDVAPGLVTFEFASASSTATGFDGSKIPNTLTVSYGHFQRAA
jgi:CubicO group peptidase (beta-lactamase class C family)